MEKRVKIVCGVVSVLGLLAAATGFGAEGTRIKVSWICYFFVFFQILFRYCEFDSVN